MRNPILPTSEHARSRTYCSQRRTLPSEIGEKVEGVRLNFQGPCLFEEFSVSVRPDGDRASLLKLQRRGSGVISSVPPESDVVELPRIIYEDARLRCD